MAGPFDPPVKNQAWQTAVSLQDLANPGSYLANPPLAAGDVKVDIDGAGFNDVTTLPTVTPAGGRRVAVSLSADEMDGDIITLQFVDQTSPKAWADLILVIQTTAPAAEPPSFPENFDALAITEEGGVTLADGVLHGGPLGSSTATLALRRLVVVASGADDAVQFGDGSSGAIGVRVFGGPGSFGSYIEGGEGGAGSVILGHGGGGLTITDDSTGLALAIVAAGASAVFIAGDGFSNDFVLTGNGILQGNLAGTTDGLTAVGAATLFTVNSTKVYADAVSGSLVKEIADNAGGGGGSVDVATIEGFDATDTIAALIAAGLVAYGASTYGGGDTLGTTELLTRLSTTRAGYLDNLSGGAVMLEASYTPPLDESGIRDAVGMTSANLDDQLQSIADDVAAVLDDTGTSGVVVDAASKTGYALAAAGLDSVMVSILPLPRALTKMAAMMLGKYRGAGTGSETATDLDGVTDAVILVCDINGNRSSVSLP